MLCLQELGQLSQQHKHTESMTEPTPLMAQEGTFWTPQKQFLLGSGGESFSNGDLDWHCVHNRIHNRLSICTYIGTWLKFNFYHKIRLSVIIILTTTSKALTCYKNYSTHIAKLIVTELTFPTSTLLSQSHGLGPGSNVNAVVTRLLLILHEHAWFAHARVCALRIRLLIVCSACVYGLNAYYTPTNAKFTRYKRISNALAF